jgi:branched-chain amino acid transport system ATP-binding protein
LAIENLFAGYDPDVPILRGVSLMLAHGEIVAVLGPNGAGKSTLAKALAGLVPIFAGEATLNGTSIVGRPAHLLARGGLGFVPQTDNVFAELSVRENLELAASRLSRSARRPRTTEMLALFPDLAPHLALPAGRLSGGQRQMLAIARALIVSPRVLMLDEPSAGLSPKLATTVLHMLLRVREAGVAILLVEQNARAALRVADRGIILVDGKVAHESPAASLLTDPKLGALYLGGAVAA